MSLDTSIESIEKHATWFTPVSPKASDVIAHPVRLMIVAKRPGVDKLMANEYAGTFIEGGADASPIADKRAALIASMAKAVSDDIQQGKLRGRVDSFNPGEPREWHDVEWVRFYEKGDSV